MEFVTSEHNTQEISVSLKRFGYFIREELKTWPYFSIIIVDWSSALIHSLIIKFNETNIHQYLEKTYQFAQNKATLLTKWTIIHTCAVHFLKRVADNVDENFPDYEGRNFVLDRMAFMVRSIDLNEVEIILRKMVTALLSS